jgi:hypothetical protein
MRAVEALARSVNGHYRGAPANVIGFPSREVFGRDNRRDFFVYSSQSRLTTKHRSALPFFHQTPKDDRGSVVFGPGRGRFRVGVDDFDESL